MIITIDGPSGTGKSTVAAQVAKHIHAFYCNTGTMYRCLAYAWLRSQNSVASLQDFLDHPPFSFVVHPNSLQLEPLFQGMSIQNDLHDPSIAHAASQLSQLPEVRLFLQAQQRAYAQQYSCVFEGRDMGSKVFPNADVKFFLTASAKVRAKRRWQELQTQGKTSLSLDQVEQDIKSRDQADARRTLDPLVIPEHAHVIDTSLLSIHEVVHMILTLIPGTQL